MKFTLGWLKDHLETDAPLSNIAEGLTNLGLEVEGITDAGAKLAAFRTAHVISAEPHPNADKLRVCKVDIGSEIVQVVCGAPNARAGLKGVFAPVGAIIPASRVQLTPAKIRGVESFGMLCSARELELSNEHDGIIELDESTPVGVPVAPLLGLDDPVIEIAITPNRGDCLGVHGVARDLAAARIGRLKPGAVKPVAGNFPCPVPIALKFDPGTEDACPLFAGRLIRGLKNGPSPDWLQKRLKAIGLRPINALVDITNYISFDRARPLHVYDAAKLAGGIHARLGRVGESLEALDGKTYALGPSMCVIADEKSVLGLGGVMGGAGSGSTETTIDVFIESALFDPLRTAATGRALQILSDARYRFERGVDPAFVLPGLELASRLILEICGGEASAVAVAGHLPPAHPAIEFAPGYVERLAGLAIEPGEAAGILENLGFALREGDSEKPTHYVVTAPSWRPDIHGPADLVEEIVRVAGLDRIPATPLPVAGTPKAVLGLPQRRARQVRRALAARGLQEAISYSFVPGAHAVLFGAEKPVRLLNPISAELDSLRPSVLPSLLAAAARNAARGFGDGALFEIGPAFAEARPEAQSLVAAGVRFGLTRPRHWSGPAAPADAYAAKADAEAALLALGIAPESLQTVSEARPWYHPGRSGSFRQGPKTVLAVFGVIHPAVGEALGLKGPVAGFEIYLDALAPEKRRGKTRPKLVLSDLMPLERDFAFIVGETVPGGDLVKAAREADRALIAEVSLFDIFSGGAVEAGKKSVAIAVRIQPRDKTLTDEEIEALSKKIVAAVSKQTGARLRQ